MNETPTEQNAEASRIGWGMRAMWGALAGLGLAVLDDRFASRFVTTTPPAMERWTLLVLLPGLGAVAGILLGGLRGKLSFVVPVVLATVLGDQLRRGPQASKMFIAEWWGVVLAVVVFVGWFGLRSTIARRPNRRFVLALLAVVAGIGLFWLCATQHRGRYDAPRAIVLGGIGVFFFAAFALLRIRLPRSLSRGLSVIAVAGLAVGVHAAIERQRVVDWADRGTTATRYPMRLLRTCFVTEPELAVSVDGPDVPFFGGEIAAESTRRLERAGGPPRGVLFLTVDALRADMVGRVVGGQPVTPRLDELVRRSFVFDRAYCPHPSSNLSMLSTFTGRYPSQVMNQPGGLDELPLVMKAMRASGVKTRAMFPKAVYAKLTSKHHFTSPSFGFDDGEKLETAVVTPWKDPTPTEVFDFVRPVDETERWFAWVHYIRPHLPYDDAASEFVAGDSDFERYAAEIRQVDAEIGELLDRMRADGLLDDTWVIISADHGEEFEEHGFTSHGGHLYEEQIHVPLIVHGPGVPTGTWSLPVSSIDLTPTLFQLFGLPNARDDRFAGRSWLPLFFGVEDSGRAPIVLSEIPPTVGFRPIMVAAIGERWKLVIDERLRRFHLFDLAVDPVERVNRAESFPERRDVLRAWIKRLRRHDPEPVADLKLRHRGGGEFVRPDFVTRIFTQLVNIQDDYVVFVASYLADGAEPRHVAGVLDQFAQRTDPDVRAALALARLGNRLDRAGDRDLVRRQLATTRDPYLMVAAYQVARRRRDPSLLDIEIANPDQARLAVDVARAHYRHVMRRDLPVSPATSALVDRAVRHSNAWIRRIGFEAMVDLPSPSPDVDLFRRTLQDDNHPRVRGAVVEAAAKVDDDALTAEIMRRVKTGADRWERRRTFSSLMMQSTPTSETPSVVRVTTDASDERIVVDSLGFHGLALPTFDFAMPSAKGPGIMALFTTWRHFDSPPTVTLRAGDWGRRIDHPFPDPDIPVLIDVPDGIDLSSVRIEVSDAGKGTLQDVIVHGALFVSIDPAVGERPSGDEDRTSSVD